MRLRLTCVAVVMVVFPALCVAGESLVNPSFEDGTNNGWTIVDKNGDPPCARRSCV